ncbi:MAG: NADH:ubiquinone oxidoreductase [Athalassotoga sp.]|uniref:NADH:ubiquinone oxidoreductase n=1 Tax=Athalassotoga sp. TaxID=2022597 RepID=UPI003CFDF936
MNMIWWPTRGLKRSLTEKTLQPSKEKVRSMKIFKRSMHIYTIDVGNSNLLNFEMKALQSAQYNTHRFGIYFSDSPRHADLLIVLGAPTEKMIIPLMNTIEQMPKPFGILLIEEEDKQNLDLPNVVGRLKNPEPSDILSTLLKIMERN